VAGQTTADDQGAFSFSNVAPGSYVVVGEKEGFESATSVVTVAETGQASADLALSSRQALDLAVEAKRLEEARISIQPRVGASTFEFNRQAIEALFSVKVFDVPAVEAQRWVFQLAKEPVKDQRLRQAISLAIDRNALVDAHRRQQVEQKSLRHEQPEPEDQDLFRAICTCVGGVIETLKPEYADLLRRVDLEGASAPEAARATGITANNAGVRLHRARTALREKLKAVCGACARHGCLDCRCQKQRL